MGFETVSKRGVAISVGGRDMNKIRWGILGTGNIAKKFATGLAACADAELVAVGSRKQETADAFGGPFNAPHRHASYEALAEDAEVDVIYVASPHALHKEHSILCLEAGKAVLCEKPFTINAKEAAEVIKVARKKKLFLMEAVWSRYLPVLVKLRELIAAGAIGEVKMVQADFGYRAGVNPTSRLFDPNLGGGALLDVGIYNLSLASMLFGPAKEVKALARLGETGVDEDAAIIAIYEGGRLLVSSTAVRTTTLHEAVVFGTDGWIRIDRPWWRSNGLVVTTHAKGDKRYETPMTSNGYNYEAEEVMRCMRAGRLESDGMTLDETLATLKTMDQIRKQWGLRYPME